MENEELAQQIREADALYTRGRTDEAMQAYMDILEKDETIAWAHSRIGAILAQEGKLEAAEQALTKALELDPELPQAHSNLGNIFYTRGQFDQAIERYQTAAKLDPTNPLYHENLHAAYKKQKKLSEAVKSLKQSHKLTREKSKDSTRSDFQTLKRKVGCTSVIAVLLLITAGVIGVTALF